MKKLIISLTVLMVAGFSLSSCLKDAKVPDPGFDVSQLGSNATILFEMPLDIYLQADRAIRFQRDSIIAKHVNQASLTFKMGYISLTVFPADTTTFPKTILLDFGSDPLMPYQGQLSIIMNGKMSTSGSNCALNFQNLISSGITFSGNDSIISLGKNTSGSMVSHFIIHGGEFKGSNNEKLTYTGNLFARFYQPSNINVFDSVEINATDDNLNAYKLYDAPTYKLQITYPCRFFNTGIINTDLTIKGALAGNMIFDYGYSSQGNMNGCDYDGAVTIKSKINLNYQNQLRFYAREFR